MKKFAAIFIFACIVMCLAACNDDSVATAPSATQGPQSTQSSLVPTKPTAEATEPTKPATRPTEPDATEPSTAPTEPPTEPTEPPTEPTEPPTQPTEPPTEPTSPPTEPTEPPTEPTEPENSLSYNALVKKYSGIWYLEGYANVFLDIFQDSYGWLLIYTNNFFLPDINYGREDGIVYPFLSGLTTEEYCIGSSFPPSSAWKEHASNTRMVFDEDCIYAGSYKFVRTPGTVEIIFCISHNMVGPTCTTPWTCSKCGYTEGEPIDCQYVNGYCCFCGKKSDEPTIKDVLLQYAGTWYLKGYSDVYITISNIYAENGIAALYLEAINYALPPDTDIDSPVAPYTEYPYDAFLETPTETYWVSGFQIYCMSYELQEELNKHNLVFEDNCIILGGKQFVRDKGSIIMYDDTCYPDVLGEWYLDGNPQSVLYIYQRYTEPHLGDYIGIVASNFDIYTLELSGSSSVRGYAARKATWEHYGIKVSNGVLTITNENGERVFYRNAVIIENGDVSMSVGESKKLYATVLPQDKSNQSVTWTSSDTSVAIINGSTVVAVGPGTAVLTVTSAVGGHTATCLITVTGAPSEPPIEPPIEPGGTGVMTITGPADFSEIHINGDVYITSTGVVTLTNVTISGNVYCYGQLTIQDCTIMGLYAYNYNGFIGCASFDGVHGKVTGRGNNNIGNGKFTDDSLDYAFATWGKM